ncbi:MAG: hypothetical protein K2N46_10355 [Lachnospiraceae bacterium]|nr:hypothetical protein [Lachnospiraceae bacterium]
MERRDYFDRMKRPTLEQVRYLDEIGRAKKKRGAAAQIAKNHDISHASISRFFRDCMDAGYLDADYQVTADGKEWLAYYKGLELALTKYLQENGVPKEDIPRNVQVMAEQMDSDVLSALLDGRGKHGVRLYDRKSRTTMEELKMHLKPGEHLVDFLLLRYEKDQRWRQARSMADRGFERPAVLNCADGEVYLELTPREMSAPSRISGGLMSGHLAGLSYAADGMLKKAEASEGRVRIPLEAFHIRQRAEGRLECQTLVTVTCSVGTVHMPESTALLSFWI